MKTPGEIGRTAPALAKAAAYANSFKATPPSPRAVGFCMHELRHRAAGWSDDGRFAEEFLLNTRLVRHDKETQASVSSYFQDAPIFMQSLIGQEESSGLLEIRLPDSIDLSMSVGHVLALRRSVRKYTGDAVELDALATLLRSAAGVTALCETEIAEDVLATQGWRSAPSAGGLYPVDLYCLCLAVRGLTPGVFRYLPRRDVLVALEGGASPGAVLESFAVPDEQIAISRANVVFLMVAQPWRSMRKYGSRGMRFVFQEAGSISQNLHLASVALGLASVDCASIYEDEAHAALGLDGLFQTLVHTVVVGCPG